MARGPLVVTVKEPTLGRPIMGAGVSVRRRSDDVSLPIYAGETGATVVTLVTDRLGEASGWLEPGQYRVDVAALGYAIHPFNVDISESNIDPLATDIELEAHRVNTINVHGIADTSALVITTDSRLINSRIPTAHKTSHAIGGSDPLTPGDIGASTSAALTDHTTNIVNPHLVTKAQVGLSSVDNTSDVDKPVSTAQQTVLNTEISARQIADSTHAALTIGAHNLTSLLSSKADLVGGLIPTSQIPARALVDVFIVASQVAQLALVAQGGDIAIRSDQHKSYVHNGGTTGTLADWTVLDTPLDTVTSVNSQIGTVVLGKADIGLVNVDNTSDVNKPISTAQQTALNLKAPLASPAFTGSVTAAGMVVQPLVNTQALILRGMTGQTIPLLSIQDYQNIQKAYITSEGSMSVTSASASQSLALTGDGYFIANTANYPTQTIFYAKPAASTYYCYMMDASGMMRWGSGSANPDVQQYRDAAGSLTIAGIGAASRLVVKGIASQTANLQEWQDSTGAVNTLVAADGSIGIGTAPLVSLHVRKDQNAMTEMRVINNILSGAGASSQISVGRDIAAGQFLALRYTNPGNAGWGSDVSLLECHGAGGFNLYCDHATASATFYVGGVARIIMPAVGGLDVLTAGKGIKLKSPDGLITKTLTIDNTGTLTCG